MGVVNVEFGECGSGDCGGSECGSGDWGEW